MATSLTAVPPPWPMVGESRLRRITAWMCQSCSTSSAIGAGNPSAFAPSCSGSFGFQSTTSTAKKGSGRNQDEPNRGSRRPFEESMT